MLLRNCIRRRAGNLAASLADAAGVRRGASIGLVVMVALACTLSLPAQRRQKELLAQRKAEASFQGSQNSSTRGLSETSVVGAALYARNCAICHEAGTIPYLNSSVLKTMSPEYIVRALKVGMMRSQGKRLNPGEPEAIAEFLTGESVTKPGRVADGLGRCRREQPKSFNGSQWNGWGVDLGNSRYQPAPDAGITADQVPRLKLKWAFGYPGKFAAYSQPVIAGHRVFIGSPLGLVFALDVDTGCSYWSFQALGGVRGAVTIGPGGVAYFGDTRANVYAINAASGKLLWRKQVDHHPLARITGSVKLHDGVLYAGVSSREEWLSSSSDYPCCTFRGSVVALKASNGALIWKTYTIADPAKPTHKSAAGKQLYGPSGAGVWGSPTLDMGHGVLYVGTGDNYTDPATSYSDSALALDLRKGKILWARQLTSGDSFNGSCLQQDRLNCPKEPGPDFDIGASPILRTLADGKMVLMVGQKSGVVYGLDPVNKGKLLWQTKVGKGGLLGGVQWGMASDPSTLFVAVSDIELRPGPTGFEPNPKVGGGLHALAIASGKKLWSAPHPAEGCHTPACSPAQSAAISVIPGVVFSGSEDGHIRAYSTQDGKVVWDYDTLRSYDTVNGIPANGGTIDGGGPALAGGMLFVNSGYGFFYGAPGNVLLAFGPQEEPALGKK